MKFRFEISVERYYNLDVSKPLFIIPEIRGLSSYTLIAEVQSFERSSEHEISLQVYVNKIARILKIEPLICAEIEEKFIHFDRSIGYLLDNLSFSINRLERIRSTESLNIKERLQHYLTLFKESYYSGDQGKSKALIYGLGYHVIKDKVDKLRLLYSLQDYKVDFLSQSVNLKVEEVFLEHRIQTKLRDRISRQQKNFLISERIKLLEEQMSEDHESINNNHFEKWRKAPDYFKKAFLRERKKLNSLSRHSPEFPQQKKLVEFLSSMPWEANRTYVPVEEVQESLDRSHFGMERIKEEILNYITAYTISEGKYNKVMCLVGPAGTGKSSIAKSIAKALNRDFIKMSLAGTSDSSILLGTPKVYINSSPGMIVNRLSKLNFNNPVILIDEVDKTVSKMTVGGTAIEFALLDVLDPENNVSFKDHFLDEEYSLQNVLFILTANSLRGIPWALFNRISPIWLKPYTVQEKVQIAKKWLLPKILGKLNLPEKDFQLEEKLISDIITNFTYEAGVRELNRCLEKVIIGVVRKKFELEDLNIKKLESLTTYFRIPNDTLREEKLPVASQGRCIGLYATSSSGGGGGITIIDVLSTENRGKWEWPVCTGYAGKVMGEAAKQAYLAAFSYLKTVCPELVEKFSERKWFIHYGNTSTPKDGPSAGVATTIAILSEFFREDTRNFAMTGEINFRGEVLGIGGVETKLMGAKSNGVVEIIIPTFNKRDFDETSDLVKENLKVYLLDNLDMVVKKIWPALIDSENKLNSEKLNSLKKYYLSESHFTNKNVKEEKIQVESI